LVGEREKDPTKTRSVKCELQPKANGVNTKGCTGPAFATERPPIVGRRPWPTAPK